MILHGAIVEIDEVIGTAVKTQRAAEQFFS